MPTSTLAGPQTYFPVALNLLEPGSVVPCELWLRHDEHHDPVLYRSRHLPFSAGHRDRLSAAGVQTVWVPFTDADTWTHYLEDRLHQRVCDPSIPVASRAEVLIRTSRSIMHDVLAEPRAKGTRARVGTVADSICDFLREPSAVAATVRMMEHDYYTYTHSLHVAVYSVALARAAGIDAPDVLGEIGRGGLMHDCGKCMLAASLINKPGRFSESEWEQMRSHPIYGLQILRETEWPASVVHDVVHSHHERMNGAGYPQGLAGRLIPEAARITAICDAYDAMTTDRAYQRAKKGREALRIIRVDDSQKYDQSLAETFIRMLLAQ